MRTTFAALRHRDYRIWSAAGFVSVAGTWMQMLGINWYVLESTGSAARMGFVVLLQTLPVLLLGSIGGVLADRLRARPLLIATQSAHALLAVALFAVVMAPGAHLLLVYALSLAGGAVAAFEGPVTGVFGASLVDRSDLGNALALNSVVSSAGRILGTSLGGVLVAVVGTASLFAVNAASFAVVIAAVLVLRPKRRPESEATVLPAPGGVRAGAAYLKRQPLILIVLAIAFVLGSLGRNYQITMAAMSDGPLGSGATGYGVLSTVFAVGTVLGGLISAQRRFLGYRTLIGAGLLVSVLQTFSGLAPGPWSFAALILPVAAGAVLIDTTVSTRVQLDTDERMRGRVLAALAATGSVAAAVGAPLLGWLSEVAGPRETLVLAGLLTAVAVVAAGWALGHRHGRRVRPIELRITLRESLGVDTGRLRAKAPAPAADPAPVPAPAFG